MDFLITSLELGLIYALLAMGVYISYKLLDIADLTVEGSFAFGGFIFAKLALMGMDPVSATLLSFLIGTLAGLVTSFLFIKLKIQPLLAGILTMTILYSVNLRVVGKSNVSLFDVNTVYSITDGIPVWLTLLLIVFLFKVLLDLFLRTEIGYLIVATGDNERLVRGIGENSNKYKLIGIMIANGFAALSGALFCQNIGFVDMSITNAIIVTALASVIIGETLFHNARKVKGTTRAIVGAIIYRIIYGLSISMGLEPSDLKAISALIVIIFLSYNNLTGVLKRRKNHAKSRTSL